MKKLPLLICLLLPLVLLPTTANGAVKAGDKCPALGVSKANQGKTFTCVKSNGKLIWNKGIAESSNKNPATNPNSQTTTSTSAQDLKACKLPIADGRGDVAIGGFPRISDRLATTGKVVTAVIMVDFADAPASMSPQVALSKVSGATDIFAEVSYGKLDYTFQPTYKWYRMSKSSTAYSTVFKRFETHREYILEALALADSDVDFSKVDSFLILANPDAKGLGYQGPGFSSIRGNGVKVDGKYLANGATSAADLLLWGPIWLNHEATHTMGLVDLYSFAEDASAVVSGQFRFTGEFSYMGLSSLTSTSPSLLGWERWILGWIEDNQVQCLKSGATSITLTPVESSGGLKLAIIPITSTKAVVVESRRAIGIDQKMDKVGALVYVVDSSIQSGLGPVKIYPQSASDPKYLQAPRGLNQSVTVEGVTITVIANSSTSDTIKIEK